MILFYVVDLVTLSESTGQLEDTLYGKLMKVNK
jgi:hypothetical protein